MATAAQMAARKIAQPKRPSGRSHGSRATTPTTPSVLDQSQQQSFSIPPSTFQFGSNTANSFPPPTQQSFNFSGPNTATSFTFGQSDANGQPQSNPFANTNGGSNGGSQQDNNMMMDSPQKPTLSASSLFQFGANTPNNASTNGFNFGQPAEQQQTGGFGSNLFSPPKSQEQTSNTNLFGQMSQPQQNGITTGGGLFGQAAQASTSAPSSAPLFSFGNTSTSAPSSAPKQEPLFKFGETTASQSAVSQAEQSKPFTGFSFGQSSSFGKPTSEAELTTPASKPLFQFGQATPAPAAQGSTTASPQPSTGLFAPKTSEPTTAPTSSSLFGRFTKTDDEQAKPESEDKSQQVEQPEPPKNPFASLFAAKPTDAASSESAKPTKSAFKFGEGASFAPASESRDAPSKSSTLFSNSAQPDSPKPVFSFGQSETSSGGLFSPKPSSITPAKNFFNLNKPTPSAEQTKQDSTDLSATKPAASTVPSPFGITPQSMQSAPQKAPEPSSSSTPKTNPFSTFGQSPAPSPAKMLEPTTTTEGPTPNKKRALFSGTSTPAAMAQSALGSFAGSSSTPKEPVPFTAPVLEKASIPKEPATRAVATEGAPQIPRHLSGDKYKSYDENYRLRNLNRLFKNKIAELDVDKFDVINLVQNYLDHRESIGEGLGRYGRIKAGVKRKAIDIDDLEADEALPGKKSKPDETQPPAVEKVQKQPVASVTTTSSGLFSSLASPKPSATFSPSKPAANSQTSNLFRSMIPSASSSSITATNVFANVFSSTAPKSTTPPSSPPKPAPPQLPKFEVPKFGGGGDFMAAFAKSSAENAKRFEDAAKEKRKADEFDSDEDDADAWEKKYEQEQRAKKAKIEAVVKGGFTPVVSAGTSKPPFSFGQPSSASTTNGSSQGTAIEIDDSGNSESGDASGSGNSGDDEQEQVTDDLPEDEAEEDDAQDVNEEEEEGEPIPELDPSQSLFGRITRDKPVRSTEKDDAPILQPAANNSFKSGLMFGNLGKSTPDAPDFSPFTPANDSMPKGTFVPTTTFNYTPTPASVSAKSWNTSSVLGGGVVREGPIPGEGLFGSRPSTPQPLSDADVKSTSVFGASRTSSTPSDNTWKRGSDIKFGTSPSKTDSAAPFLEVTSATPPPKEQHKPFASLFGQSTDKNGTTNGASTSLGFNFGSAANTTSPAFSAPGFLSAASHLGGGTASGTSSRATSPGIATDNESVATDNTEDYSNEPQAPSLMASNAGEEDEDPIYESKANIYRSFSQKDLDALGEKEKGTLVTGWNMKGSGNVRVLRHKETGKCRIVFRAEPNARIILNARVLPTVKYDSALIGKANGQVQFFVMGEDKKMQMWMLKVKTKEMSDEMSKVLEENKRN